MVKLKEVIGFLESLVPLSTQDSWDNSGLQIGWENQDISTVGFALSVCADTAKRAVEEKVDLLITHHPITISGVKSLVWFKHPENLLLKLASQGIAVYSVHTNLDTSPLGPTALMAKELALEDTAPIQELPPYGLVGKLPQPLSQKALLCKLLEFLPKDAFRVVGYSPELEVKKVAVCSGSGGSFVEAVAGKADVFITGDVKYHEALKALDLGLTVFDMGHYGTERLFYTELEKRLKARFPSLKVKLLEEKSPFEVVKPCSEKSF